MPAPSIGLALYAEHVGGEGEPDPVFTGASLRFAPGLSGLPAYHSPFSLLHRPSSGGAARGERYVVQVLRFDPPPSGQLGEGKDGREERLKPTEEPDASETDSIEPHSPPWLVCVHGEDTVHDLRRRLLERAMPSVLRDFLAPRDPEEKKGKDRRKEHPLPPVHLVREFNRCVRSPLAEGARLVPLLEQHTVGRMSPSLALGHPTPDRLRHDRRTGTAVAIRR